MPTNGSVGTITVSPRYVSQIGRMLEREQFDVLHFHEPFVPFLSLILLHQSRSVNIATFHAYAGFSPSYEFGRRFMQGHASRLHGRIAVSAAARHFIDRYFPGDYKVIPNGVDLARFERAVPLSRWQDGTPNLLFVGRHEPRKGLLELLKAYRLLRREGVALPAADRRLWTPGARGTALRPDPPAARRRIPRPGQRCREGPAVQDRRRLRFTGYRSGIVRDRAARGDGRRRADRVLAISTATRASSGVARTRCSSSPTSPRSWRPRSPDCWATQSCASRCARLAHSGRPSSAGSASRPRSRRTTAS